MPASFSPSCRAALFTALFTSLPAIIHAETPVNTESVTTLRANEAKAREGEFAEARGDVVITRDNLKVEADWGRYSIPTDRIRAGDKVTLTKGKDTLSGSLLDMSINAREGDLLDPVFQMQRGAIRGDAVKLIFGGPDRYTIRTGRLTTCERGQDDWYIHASSLELDYTTNIGQAWNGWVEFKGVPFVYYPWLDFPLDGSRKSGMLAPSIGFSSSNGFQLQTPVYLNLAPNYDATLYPRYMERRGFLLGGELRYLEPNYAGNIHVEGIRDRVDNTARSAVSFQHKQILSPQLQLDINAQTVKDNSYLSDFGDQLSVSSQSNLPREGKLTYSGQDWNSFLRWQRYQTLDTPTNIVEKPYDRIPQLYFSAQPQLFHGLLATASGELTDFSHPTKMAGVRAWAYPSVAIPFNESWGFIIPKIGLHATTYQLRSSTSTPNETLSRAVPVFSLDSGLYFERETSIFGRDMVQTLEPRAYYLHIPYRDQSKLPVFDSGETDLSFTQLFSENQFSGQDRINDANQVTLALTSRLFEGNNGIERINATIGQRYYFADQRVTLTAPGREDSVRSSDLLMTLGARFWADLSSSYAMQYNQLDHSLRRADLSLTWRPGEFKTLNLRYVTNRVSDPDIRQFDISGQLPLGAGWTVLGRFNYSISNRRAMETLGGFEYNANCWALRLAAQRYATSTNEYHATFFALLELGGVAGIGSNPLDTIRQSIPGYANTYTPPRF